MIHSRTAAYWAIIAALLVSAGSQVWSGEAITKSVILSTTTSTQDIGLLELDAAFRAANRLHREGDFGRAPGKRWPWLPKATPT
jgi:ABC-type tungstate transport system permease subunit